MQGFLFKKLKTKCRCKQSPTGRENPTVTALISTLRCITGSKEATNMAHKCGIGISCTDVCFLTDT